jgi:hypothetical protein
MIEWAKTKAWPFIKKYWIYILVIPAALIFLYNGSKLIKRIFYKPAPPPDQTADRAALDQSIGEIDKAAGSKIDKIESDAKSKKNGIDKGSPTPAAVFDEMIKKEKKS